MDIRIKGLDKDFYNEVIKMDIEHFLDCNGDDVVDISLLYDWLITTVTDEILVLLCPLTEQTFTIYREEYNLIEIR